jgi:putative membrane protein
VSLLLHVLDGGPVTPATLWQRWRIEPAVLVLVVVSGALYAAGIRRLWRRAGRGHVVSGFGVAAFYAGLLALLVALCSPLDALAETLFSAHMVQHVILIAVAPPLLVLGIPTLPLLWGLPHDVRIAVGRAWNASRLGVIASALVRPIPALVLSTLALWLWHLPGPYATALANPAVHALEHACFLTTALLVWWVAIRPIGHHANDIAWALFVLIGTFVSSGALGAILTFSDTPWYYAQSVGAGAWGLTALEDQQLAGLIMWIPAGFAYIIGILAIASRALHDPAPPPPASVTASVAEGDGPGGGAELYALH